VRFAGALLTYDPSVGHPIYVALARIIHIFIPDRFTALVTLSVIASAIGALLIGFLGARILGSASAGAAAALIVLLSPALLVFGPLANAESVTMALVAGAFLALAEKRLAVCALLAAASIGARLMFDWPGEPQFRPELLIRFVAHPWGGKFLSLPLLAVALIGAVVAWRKHRSLPLIALVAFGLLQIVASSLFASPFDGVRPVIPSLLATGVLAAAAIARWPYLSLLFGAASLVYTWPLITARRAVSPAVAAMGSVRAGFVVADPDLAPFRGDALTPERFDGLMRRNPLRVTLVMHGRSPVAAARTFEWPDSDAYGKITSERFRTVSAIPAPRYSARSGVHHYESSPERGEWRWLSARAEIELPRGAVLHCRLPADAPIESNRITAGMKSVEIARGQSVDVEVPAGVVTVISERDFESAGRRLAVQLVQVSSPR
jgi:hypothetical protein